jgi:hypothetical protein
LDAHVSHFSTHPRESDNPGRGEKKGPRFHGDERSGGASLWRWSAGFWVPVIWKASVSAPALAARCPARHSAGRTEAATRNREIADKAAVRPGRREIFRRDLQTDGLVMNRLEDGRHARLQFGIRARGCHRVIGDCAPAFAGTRFADRLRSLLELDGEVAGVVGEAQLVVVELGGAVDGNEQFFQNRFLISGKVGGRADHERAAFVRS